MQFVRICWRNFHFISCMIKSVLFEQGCTPSNKKYPIQLHFSVYSALFDLDFDWKYFWAWTDFQSYLDFMLAVWLIGAIITFFMLPYMWFNEIMGFMAVFIEAMLGKCRRRRHTFASKQPSHRNRFLIRFTSFIIRSRPFPQVPRNSCAISTINQRKA